MTTDPFTTAARAESEKRFGFVADMTIFEDAAEWARTYLAEQEMSDAEQAARFAVESKHHLHGTQCLCGFESHRARSRTQHIMTRYFAELSAARGVGRDAR